MKEITTTIKVPDRFGELFIGEAFRPKAPYNPGYPEVKLAEFVKIDEDSGFRITQNSRPRPDVMVFTADQEVVLVGVMAIKYIDNLQ